MSLLFLDLVALHFSDTMSSFDTMNCPPEPIPLFEDEAVADASDPFVYEPWTDTVWPTCEAKSCEPVSAIRFPCLSSSVNCPPVDWMQPFRLFPLFLSLLGVWLPAAGMSEVCEGEVWG